MFSPASRKPRANRSIRSHGVNVRIADTPKTLYMPCVNISCTDNRAAWFTTAELRELADAIDERYQP